PEQLAAAEHILKAALATISLIRKRFVAARLGFLLPTTFDSNVVSNGHAPPITVVLGTELLSLLEDGVDVLESAPKLRVAYSSTNAPLQLEEERPTRILSALDAVESNGDLRVWSARKELARVVEYIWDQVRYHSLHGGQRESRVETDNV
ncbi:hypothetical protein LXA43DRAFT_899254, partial [Ganoderma leucocontextum]